jgi:Flp pilus assembly protein TadG
VASQDVNLRQCDAKATRSGGLLTLFRRLRQPAAWRNRNRELAGCENGQSLVEFALVAPIMFGFVFGLIEACLAFYTHACISELAREGTRYAAFHGPSCMTSGGSSCEVTATSGTGSYSSVNSYVTGLGIPNLCGGTVTANTTYPGGEAVGQPVVVTVSYVFPYHLPFVTQSNLTLTSQSEMYILQ